MKDCRLQGGLMINPACWNEDVVSGVGKVLESEGSVQVKDFFEASAFEKLVAAARKMYVGEVYAPLEGRYQEAVFRKKEAVREMERWIKTVGIVGKSKPPVLKLFRHGSYTLCNDLAHEEDGVIGILELTREWWKEWGGYTSFMSGGEEVARVVPLPNALTLVRT